VESVSGSSHGLTKEWGVLSRHCFADRQSLGNHKASLPQRKLIGVRVRTGIMRATLRMDVQTSNPSKKTSGGRRSFAPALFLAW
jgi:hypothetical protein